ncbi:hypothetical protein NDU88_006971 [Pleurodeles waltl]|uniref:Uncharacterized protein n=1 Tax=Pleurodeles waltl TaxID=8319 RepID=A0AAV7WGB5_PLEWA|nr:hypothetical protein NDU88_006971 [Pleurodeles waltl]
MVVTSAAGRIITAGAPVHWLLGPIGSNVNQCSIALRSTTAYRDGVQRQRCYPTIPLSQHRQLGHMRRWRNPPVYRPLVDLLTMEERHLIVTYRFDRATIQELCTQLEPDLMSPIRHPTGIPPDVQVLSVLHFFSSGSFSDNSGHGIRDVPAYVFQRVVQSVVCPAETRKEIHHIPSGGGFAYSER